MAMWLVIRGFQSANCPALFDFFLSAKILAHLILEDPRIRSYSDIGRKAFGPMATPAISFMFCLELFAVRSVLLPIFFLGNQYR